jgi:hypothetical protein
MAGGADTICCGLMGERGSCFCTKLSRHCSFHGCKCARMFMAMDMEDRYYINDVISSQAFTEPCLPKEAALCSPSFRDLLGNSNKKTLKTWSTIFWHLNNKAKEANARTPTREGGGDGEDQGLIQFAAAMKMPGRVAFDSFNSPKRMKFGDEEESAGDDRSISLGLDQRQEDSRLMHLKHSLAMVKGELGTRAPDAQYASIHGGIQGAYSRLAAFEEKLASKASTSRVNGLILDMNACYAKSLEACRAVDQLVNLGSITKIVTLVQEVWEMALRTRILEDTLKKALAFVLELSEYVSKLLALGTPVPMGGIPQEDYQTFKASQTQAIVSIRQELKGGGIELGGFAFDGEDACIAFAREHLTTDPTYHCTLSLMFTLCMPLDEVIYKSDMQGGEIHAAQRWRGIPCSWR